jgi:radical SAM superfamily enzyme YgiQ (UPF0313 family)
VAADVVAFSPIPSGITRAYSLAVRLRERGITCIRGGAHVSALPNEALEHFDVVIIGEGETPWKKFLQDFEQGKMQETYFGRMDVSLENLGTPRCDFENFIGYSERDIEDREILMEKIIRREFKFYLGCQSTL